MSNNLKQPGMEINLNKCVPGQELRTRDGRKGIYRRKSSSATAYPHRITVGEGEHSYSDNGRWHAFFAQPLDIVAIVNYVHPADKKNVIRLAGFEVQSAPRRYDKRGREYGYYTAEQRLNCIIVTRFCGNNLLQWCVNVSEHEFPAFADCLT